jgi:hypothetical protein
VRQQFDRLCVSRLCGNIKGCAFIAARVEFCTPKNQFFYYGCISVERCFRQGAPAALIAGIYISALVEQVTNCIESALTRGKKKRRTATALTVHSGAGHLQQTHIANVSVRSRAREVRLTPRTSAR